MRLEFALAAAALFGLAACGQSGYQPDAETEAAAHDAGESLEAAGEDLGEAAAHASEAAENVINEAAGAVERASDDDETTQP